MKYITVPESFILDKRIDNQIFSYHIGIKWYCSVYPGGYYSLKAFLGTIYGDIGKITKDQIKLVKSMNEIKCIDSYIFQIDINENKEKYYGFINVDNYLQIIRSNKKSKYGIIRFLCLLNKCMYGNNSIQISEMYFAEQLGINKKTISEYVKYLKQIDIIKVKRSGIRKNNIYLLVE